MQNNSPQSFCFFLRTYNDIDHITPIIYKFLESGEQVIIIFFSDFDYENDYRLRFLMSYENLTIYKLNGAYGRNLRSRLIRWLKYNICFAKRLLIQNNVKICVFEWGNGYKDSSFSKMPCLISSFFYKSLRVSFLFAAKSLNIKTVCVPHGMTVMMNENMSKYLNENYFVNGIKPDFSDRNIFDEYVYQSEFHRNQQIGWGIEQNITRVWGSARFYKDWAALNLKLCPRFEDKFEFRNNLKIVFFVAQWNYNVDFDKTVELINKLIELPEINIIFKESTRGGEGGISNLLLNKGGNSIVVGNDYHSPALVSWADVVIAYNSSIGIEALIQNKILINLEFLHTNFTIFKSYSACHNPDNQKDFFSIVHEIKEGSHKDFPEGKLKLLKDIVYGGKNPPVDILEIYLNNIMDEK